MGSHVARLAGRIQREIWPSPSPALTTSSLGWMLDVPQVRIWRTACACWQGVSFCPAVEDFELFQAAAMLDAVYPGLRVLRLRGSSSRRDGLEGRG